MKATSELLNKKKALQGFDGCVGLLIVPVYDEDGSPCGVAITGEKFGEAIEGCPLANLAEEMGGMAGVLVTALNAAIASKDKDVAKAIFGFVDGLRKYVDDQGLGDDSEAIEKN